MPDMRELGSNGVEISGGYVLSEWNRKLRNTAPHKLYTEMRDNDPVIGAVLFVIELLLSSQEWNIERGKGRRAREAARFLEELRDDMAYPWEDFIYEAASSLHFGWAYHEIVYKIRDDGRIGWEKIPLRAQSTLDRWATNDKNEIIGMWQNDPYVTMRSAVFIPRSKAVHFVTTPVKGNPEGRSILRSAVRPYQFLKRLQELEAIGVERELAGLPVMQVPPAYMASNAPAEKVAEREMYKRMMQQIKRDEREGLIIPAETISSSTGGQSKIEHTGFKFELMKGGGSRAIDTNSIISRYENRIATTMLAQFIMLGSQSGAGSYALADKQASVFTIALQSALNRICQTINHQLVTDIMNLNGYDAKEHPKFVVPQLQDVSLSTLATFVNQLVAGGVIQPDDELEAHLRSVADLPLKGKPRVVVDPATGLPVEDGSNPFGAGRPEDGDSLDRDDPNTKRVDPADAEGKDKANVRTEKK